MNTIFNRFKVNGLSLEEISKASKLYKALKDEGKQHLFIEKMFEQEEYKKIALLQQSVPMHIMRYVLNSNLTEEVKVAVLYDPKLFKYGEYIAISDEEVLSLRERTGLPYKESIIKHFLFASDTGASTGCGCKYCLVKNKEWIAKQRVREVNRNLENVQNLIDLFYKRDFRKTDPFDSELVYRCNSILLKASEEHQRPKKWNKDRFPEKYKVPVWKTDIDPDIVVSRLKSFKGHLQGLKEQYFSEYSTIKGKRIKFANLLKFPIDEN